ncbi:hypothetical protein GF380_06155 [Candidatus Uhrbacteria bacterium]|nr:hypothetical protein [Candidatus Uhrbacteria bacterium]MBD3284557.1 hypothetical protein [Candidatus Uhrbacteria bacterium]
MHVTEKGLVTLTIIDLEDGSTPNDLPPPWLLDHAIEQQLRRRELRSYATETPSAPALLQIDSRNIQSAIRPVRNGKRFAVFPNDPAPFIPRADSEVK